MMSCIASDALCLCFQSLTIKELLICCKICKQWNLAAKKPASWAQSSYSITKLFLSPIREAAAHSSHYDPNESQVPPSHKGTLIYSLAQSTPFLRKLRFDYHFIHPNQHFLLENFKFLNEIVTDSSLIPDESLLNTIVSLSNTLRILRVECFSISEQSLQILAQNLVKLEEFHLLPRLQLCQHYPCIRPDRKAGQGIINQPGLTALANAASKKLHCLTLDYNYLARTKDVDFPGACIKLNVTNLTLFHYDGWDKLLDLLPTQQLKQLTLHSCLAFPRQLYPLANYSELETLHCETSHDLASPQTMNLAQLRKLRRLVLKGGVAADQIFHQLANFYSQINTQRNHSKEGRETTLNSDESSESSSEGNELIVSQLQEVSVEGRKVNHSTLSSLGENCQYFPHLTSITLENTAILGESLHELAKFPLSTLILYNNRHLLSAHLLALSNLSRLGDFQFIYAAEISGDVSHNWIQRQWNDLVLFQEDRGQFWRWLELEQQKLMEGERQRKSLGEEQATEKPSREKESIACVLL
jgi:hypothetical protein